MKIRIQQPESTVAVYQSQSRFLAMCIRRLERAFADLFVGEYDPDEGEAEVFWTHPDYELFHDAAYACGFVCDDLEPSYPIDVANLQPHKTLETESFDGVRHYVHTLLRAERSNRVDGYASPICVAVRSGALGVVAARLETDEGIYE